MICHEGQQHAPAGSAAVRQDAKQLREPRLQHNLEVSGQKLDNF